MTGSWGEQTRVKVFYLTKGVWNTILMLDFPCPGDSGGPVWRNIRYKRGKVRATQIGVLSRGTQIIDLVSFIIIEILIRRRLRWVQLPWDLYERQEDIQMDQENCQETQIRRGLSFTKAEEKKEMPKKQ